MTADEEVGDVQCKYCKKTGHWVCQYRKKKRDQAAHVAQAEEGEEPMLMVATAQVNAVISSTPPPATPAMPVDSAPIHIEEDKLFVQLSDGHEGEATRWILDTGATNHMTGARSAFFELDNGVHSAVKFGDGSVVSIFSI